MCELDMGVLIEKSGFVFRLLRTLHMDKLYSEAFFCGMLLWCLNLNDRLRGIVKRSDIWRWRWLSLENFTSYVKKNMTLKMKALQNTIELDLTQCFEFEVLINRGVGEVNWDDEKKHRQVPNVCTISANSVYHSARHIFRRLLSSGHKPSRRQWSTFWAQRWKWAPPGSDYSQWSEDDQYKARDSTIRNKLFSLCAMPRVDMNYFSERLPQMRAKAMTKYEWGKQRAIYSVDKTSFVLSQFAMGDCEGLLSHIFPIGPSASSEQVREDVSMILRQGIPFCFDFEDFNSQHSTQSMQMVLLAYKDIFSRYMSDEQITALLWQIASLDDMGVLDTKGEYYQCKGTLLSGWRLTSFMNTILNKVYIDECIQGEVLPCLHNGDDVLASVNSFHQVQLLMKNAKLFNIRFQVSKCFLGAIAEFLRVDHKTGTGSQYLARAVATYVHAPTESILPNDLIAVVRSQKVRYEEILSRGGNRAIMTKVLKAQRRFLTKIWKVDEDTIDIIEKTHVSMGGVNDILSKDSLEWHIDRVPTRTSFDPGGKLELDRERELPGARDYAEHLVRYLKLPDYLNRLTNAVKRSIFTTTIANKFSVKVRPVQSHERMTTVIEANQYAMFRGICDNTKTLLAKAFNIPLYELGDGLSYIVDSLRFTHDPLRTLVMWT
nr:RNA-dependent RNA polymerase [Helianthus annuus leaf-associated totivirus 1]